MRSQFSRDAWECVCVTGLLRFSEERGRRRRERWTRQQFSPEPFHWYLICLGIDCLPTGQCAMRPPKIKQMM